MDTALAKYVSFIYLLYVTCLITGIVTLQVTTHLPTNVQDALKNTNVTEVKQLLNNSRRIIMGSEAHANRPYMVFLKLPANNPKYKDYRTWLCGGVIVHEEYILTSAACIEDAKHFYVVSGTFRHNVEDDHYNNQCIKFGAKKAVWKCIPRNYVFDGHENDNIRWMNNDIAVVKVEEEFDFTRRIRGCDFVPRPICYNNQSAKFENPGTVASIAGWGSMEKYNEETMTQDLLEADVTIISKNRCKRRWGKRYYHIIDNYMICTKDLIRDPSEICQEKYVDCTDIMYSDFESGEPETRRVIDPASLVLHSAYHNDSGRKQGYEPTGGFCENDHGGPLVYGDGVNAIVIGIISACLVKERTNKCYGPFLYTSVYKNRILINCAIYKDLAISYFIKSQSFLTLLTTLLSPILPSTSPFFPNDSSQESVCLFSKVGLFERQDCNKLFRSSITHTEVEMSWIDHPDGPAKNEIHKMRRNNDNATQIPEKKEKSTLDKAEQHEGVIVRASLRKSENDNSNTTSD